MASPKDRLAQVADRSTLRLTHYGRKTRKPYQVTIWFVVDAGDLYLATMNRERQWVRNVTKTPRVQLQCGSESFTGTVEPMTGLVEKRRVYDLFTRKYWVMWLYDHIAALFGRDPRKTEMDMGRGGFFQVRLAS